MAKIVFFCIPAHGHTNPTLEVVRELVRRGNDVRYYSYEPFREKIEAAGATFVPCDAYDIPVDMGQENAAKVGLDVGLSIRVLTETTLALDEMVCSTLAEFQPDCVVADSMAVWGKFAALKMGFPYVCSTTTFAFNRYAAKVMKQSPAQLFGLLKALPSVHRDVKRLQAKGYPVKNLLSIMNSDESTPTIVYTSPQFQPCAETFPATYSFVGPSIRPPKEIPPKGDQKRVYISMGTVNNRLIAFYQECFRALGGDEVSVLLSAGQTTDLSLLGEIPANFTVRNTVDQIEELQITDVFLSHCGMNSVNESLYYGVPLVMHPITAEQGGVANRVCQLNAGELLAKPDAASIRAAVFKVLSTPSYRENALEISRGFRAAGGPKAAADAILRVAR